MNHYIITVKIMLFHTTVNTLITVGGGERDAPRRPAEKGGEGETAAFRLANKMPPRSTPALCPARAWGAGPGPPMVKLQLNYSLTVILL